MATASAELRQFLAHLHRGGAAGYWWVAEGRRSIWWPAGNPAPIPDGRVNVYFGVHPTAMEAGPGDRSRIETVTAVNCLFAEFDTKDWLDDKAALLRHVESLEPQASVIVDSGGGYHAYWLLAEPVLLSTDEEREHTRALQAAWVRYTGGDDGAKDLARVLRVPGTYNYKPERGPDFPRVRAIRRDLFRQYSPQDLERACGGLMPQPARGARQVNAAVKDQRYERYGQKALAYELAELTSAANGARNKQLNRSAFALGQLVGAGVLDHYRVESALASAAVGCGLPDREAARTIRSGLEAGERDPRQLPEQDTDVYTPSPQQRKGTGSAVPKPTTPTHDELRDRWIQEHPQTCWAMEQWHRYSAGVWQPLDEEAVRDEITRCLEAAKEEGLRPTAGMVTSVHTMATDRLHRPARIFDADADLLVCQNGTLHIPTLTLREHSPAHWLTSGVSYDYDPAAAAPTWVYFLESTLEPPVVAFLQEFSGYALTTDCSLETAVWLYGPAGSGKSTFLEGLEAMLGSRCGQLGLADVERSRFALGNVPGKTLLVAKEQPAAFVTTSHLLNSMISGETITMERKFSHPFDMRSRAKLCWAMNDLPRVPDAGNGLFRRVKVVQFTARPPEAVLPEVKDRIRFEGAGILNWALVGLARLREQGRFEVPAMVQDATRHFQMNNDIPAMFLQDSGVLLGPDFKTRAGELYAFYKAWCLDNGHKPASSTSMADEWRRLGLERYRAMGQSMYRGVGLPPARDMML